jgi:hypothetical protein
MRRRGEAPIAVVASLWMPWLPEGGVRRRPVSIPPAGEGGQRFPAVQEAPGDEYPAGTYFLLEPRSLSWQPFSVSWDWQSWFSFFWRSWRSWRLWGFWFSFSGNSEPKPIPKPRPRPKPRPWPRRATWSQSGWIDRTTGEPRKREQGGSQPRAWGREPRQGETEMKGTDQW